MTVAAKNKRHKNTENHNYSMALSGESRWSYDRLENIVEGFHFLGAF